MKEFRLKEETHIKLNLYWEIVTVPSDIFVELFDDLSGLSMNILWAGNKSLVQLSFFTNSTGDLLPTLEFLGGLYNFCNLVIMFSLM